MKNIFEHKIKEALDNFEMPYKEGAWESFEKNLSPAKPFYKSPWIIGGVAIVAIAIISIGTYLMVPAEETHNNISVLTKNKTTYPSINTSKNNITQSTESKKELKKDTKEALPVAKAPITKTKEAKKTEKTISSAKIKNPTEITPKEVKANSTPKTTLQTSEKKVDPSPLLTTEINEVEMVSAEFFIEKTICQGNTVKLVAEENNPTFTYRWNINNTIKLEGNDQSYVTKNAGTDLIELHIIQNGKTIATKTSTLKVLEAPTSDVEITNNENSIINEFQFTNFDNANTIVWNFGDGTRSTEPSTKHSFKHAGNFTCTYKVTSPNGCSAKGEKSIDLKGYYNIRTDYGFSPNGDNLNDEFIPEEIKIINRSFEMNIYARNGQLLYTTNDVNKPWNGQTMNGTKSPFGSYVWVISITNELGVPEVYKGTITNVSN